VSAKDAGLLLVLLKCWQPAYHPNCRVGAVKWPSIAYTHDIAVCQNPALDVEVQTSGGVGCAWSVLEAICMRNTGILCGLTEHQVC